MGEIISGARRLSTAAMQERAARAAAGLRSLGLGVGDVLALLLRNDLPFFEASTAAGLLGVYPTPINWHATSDEARYVLENSGAKALLVHADLLAPIEAVIPPDVVVLVVDTPPEVVEAYGVLPELCVAPHGRIQWESWLQSFAPLADRAKAAPGTIIYTSGTTGLPKGVRRSPPTREQREFSTRNVARLYGFAGRAAHEIVTVVTGPMYHAAPNAYGLMAARGGARVHLQPRFDPEGLLQMIDQSRVTHIHMAPIMFNRLLNLPADVRAKYDHSSLQFVVHAAAPCPQPIKRAMIDWWGPVIHEYYGSTETGGVAFCDTQEWLAHPGTVGKPVEGADVRVVDGEGRSLPAGEIGEIVCKLPGAVDFTYHGDGAKRIASEKAGLIAPGDIGYFDADGFLYLCDRAKDMINSGGVKIYPAEIEAVLHRMPGVADCAVFGVPDDEFGESVHAVIEPLPGVAISEEDVLGFLLARVSKFKAPRTLEFRRDLPREDSGKIFKRKLREPFWAGRATRI